MGHWRDNIESGKGDTETKAVPVPLLPPKI